MRDAVLRRADPAVDNDEASDGSAGRGYIDNGTLRALVREWGPLSRAKRSGEGDEKTRARYTDKCKSARKIMQTRYKQPLKLNSLSWHWH